MNWKSTVYYLPYILLLLANLVYLYANGFEPIGTYPELFVYNLVFFIVIGIVIIIKLNLLLHSWFVKQEGDVKEKTKTAIQKLNIFFQFVLSIFKKGNQKMMIKIFFFLNIWILINRYVPGFLLGLLVGTYYQYKGVLEEKFKNQFAEISNQTQKLINSILKMLPKYLNSSQTTSKIYNS